MESKNLIIIWDFVIKRAIFAGTKCSMEMIRREQQAKIEALLGGGKAIVIMGARQVGKSTLLGEIFRGKEGVMWMNGDDLI